MTFAYDLPLALPGEKPVPPPEHLRRYDFTAWGKAEHVAAALDAQNAAIRAPASGLKIY